MTVQKEGLLANEWGDHICLIATANTFGITVGLVSSTVPGVQYIHPFGHSSTPELFLGHEHEHHYLALESLVGSCTTAIESQEVVVSKTLARLGGLASRF